MGCGASQAQARSDRVESPPVIQNEEVYTWLHNNHLEMYYDKIISNGYDHLDFLYAASQEDLKLLATNVGMSDFDKKEFLNLLLPVIILATPVL
tara:strand:- start:186 stop:467 length:282 start_codon:yes stop_codon:yes gene_type:complete